MELLTVADVAKELKCSNQKVWALINGRGKLLKLPAIKIGKSYLIDRVDLEKFVNGKKIKR